MVTVTQGVLSSAGVSTIATVYYTFDSDFHLLNAEVGGNYRDVHKKLELSGLMDHPLDAAEEATLFPVRMWDGNRLVEVRRR